MSYISEETQAAVICAYHNNYPRAFQVSLDTGAYTGDMFRTNSQYTGVQTPVMTQFGTSDSEILIYYPISNGYFVWIWDTVLGYPTSKYEQTSGVTPQTAIYGSRLNGMMYFASGSLTPLSIFKFYYDDPSQRTTVIDGNSGFTRYTDYSYNTDSSIMHNTYNHLLVSLVDYSTSISDVTDYNEISKSTNNIVYIGGRNQVHYIQSGFVGDISYDYFCTTSAASLTVGVYDPSGSTNITSWLSINNDFEHLTVNTPIVNSETNYSYGIYYDEGTNNITVENTLTIYTCSLQN